MSNTCDEMVRSFQSDSYLSFVEKWHFRQYSTWQESIYTIITVTPMTRPTTDLVAICVYAYFPSEKHRAWHICIWSLSFFVKMSRKRKIGCQEIFSSGKKMDNQPFDILKASWKKRNDAMEKLVNLLTFPKFSRAYPWRDKRGCIQRVMTKSKYCVNTNF